MSWKALSSSSVVLDSDQTDNILPPNSRCSEARLHSLRQQYHEALGSLNDLPSWSAKYRHDFSKVHSNFVELIVSLENSLDIMHNTLTSISLQREWKLVLFLARKNLIDMLYRLIPTGGDESDIACFFKSFVDCEEPQYFQSEDDASRSLVLSLDDLYAMALDNYELMLELDMCELPVVQITIKIALQSKDYWTFKQLWQLHKAKFTVLYRSFVREMEEVLCKDHLLMLKQSVRSKLITMEPSTSIITECVDTPLILINTFEDAIATLSAIVHAISTRMPVIDCWAVETEWKSILVGLTRTASMVNYSEEREVDNASLSLENNDSLMVDTSDLLVNPIPSAADILLSQSQAEQRSSRSKGLQPISLSGSVSIPDPVQLTADQRLLQHFQVSCCLYWSCRILEFDLF
jgi:hypothetical protein